MCFASDPINIDGQFNDWSNVPILYSDPQGDNIIEDFSELKMTNDNDFLFLYFAFHNGDQLLQDSNQVMLYIDTDNNASSGLFINGIGAEFVWNIGFRTGYFYSDTGRTLINQNDITLRRGPNVSAEKFEFGLSLHSDFFTLNSSQVADTIFVQFNETDPFGDFLPDNGNTLSYIIDPANIPLPEPISIQKNNANDIRVLTYNVQNHLWNVFEKTEMQQRLERVLKALKPDIIAFQHVHSDTTVDSLIENWFPDSDWYRMGNYGPPAVYDPESDKIIFSKFPIITREFWFISSKRMYGCLLDTKSELGKDLLIINTHLPAYAENDIYRQSDADNFVQSMRELQPGDGLFFIEKETPFIVLGDFNMYGKGRVLRTLVEGNIWDEDRYGQDFAPDWDSSPLTDLFSRHTHIRMGYTFRSDGNQYPPSRIDLILYSDSVIEIGNHYILNTLAISDVDLLSYNLEKNDTEIISRHLPRVIDIASVHAVGIHDSDVNPPNKYRLYNAYPNPFNARTIITYEIASHSNVSLKVYDISGKEVTTLIDQDQNAGIYTIHFDAKKFASGIYIYRLKAGVFQQSRKIILIK